MADSKLSLFLLELVFSSFQDALVVREKVDDTLPCIALRWLLHRYDSSSSFTLAPRDNSCFSLSISLVIFPDSIWKNYVFFSHSKICSLMESLCKHELLISHKAIQSHLFFHHYSIACCFAIK